MTNGNAHPGGRLPHGVPALRVLPTAVLEPGSAGPRGCLQAGPPGESVSCPSIPWESYQRAPGLLQGVGGVMVEKLRPCQGTSILRA